MIIDDNEIDQRLYRRLIARSGRVGVVHSFAMAADALEFLGQRDRPKIDVILLDINMPRMNGFEFLQEATTRFGPGLASSVIIMLTTSLLGNDRDRAFSSGLVRDYLDKPLSLDHLEHIDALIHGEARRQEASGFNLFHIP